MNSLLEMTADHQNSIQYGQNNHIEDNLNILKTKISTNTKSIFANFL